MDLFDDEIARRVRAWAQGQRLPIDPWKLKALAPPPSPALGGHGVGPPVNVPPAPTKAPVAAPTYTGPAYTGALPPPAPAPAAPPSYLHPHLDPNYVGYGTPNLEWWGPNPDPRYSDWRGDVMAPGGRQHWRRDYDPNRPGYIMGEY